MKKQIVLLSLLALTLALTAVLTACGNDEPPVPVTVAEICEQQSGTNIIATGYLAMPLSIICEGGQCKINFYDDTGSVLVELITSNTPESSALKLPPNQYTADDLQFVYKDGAPGNRTSPVKITGAVQRRSQYSCYLDAYYVEQP